MIIDGRVLWFTHYDGDGDGDGDGNAGDGNAGDGNAGDGNAGDGNAGEGGKEKSFNQKEVDNIVSKRTEKVRKAQKTALARMEQLEQTVKMTEEERETLRAEIEELQQSTLSATEIAKREQKKSDDKYETALGEAKKEAGEWQGRFNDLKINYEITNSASEHGVLAPSIPFLESFLRPNTKLVEHKNEDGETTGKYISQVVFQDSDEDGNSIEVQMTIPEVVKRMKELPDKYGHLFEAHMKGGTGTTNSKTSRGPDKDIRNLSVAEYVKLRKEDPEKIFGPV